MSRPGPVSPSRLSIDRLSLVTKVARLYHEDGLRQPEIATRLHVSQSRVSRLLKEAVALGIVRTIVVPPAGVHSELEDTVRDRFGLADVVVADTSSDDEYSILAALSGAGAAYFETTLTGHDRVGISSWSSTLLATVDKMAPRTVSTADVIVQVLGGLGTASVQMKATHLVERMAAVTGASPVFFSAPGIVASRGARDAILEDQFAREVLDEWSRLTVLIAGIGSVAPSPMLKDSGNAISATEIDALSEAGAVGDICLHFFDAQGRLIETGFSERTVGIDAAAMRAVPRRVGIAGGARKYEAVRAALRGRWIDVMITDVDTARRLAAEPEV
ncbi:sugar-binding transcriptional regulator [Rathayibacter caricis DSM 15933]|jgi:DNA-binding transcriptional regulator LsrR (DeoR family)|uniref:Sugar-binding transcriptional regulator n=1 Tax=Rathayibacter caricis DSM 15933 TaxID=1328867 RepID=A0A2T4UQJ4_9MICO|nr:MULTISPECIES: sugar-binding transcriptional regulator [Rathayibacter]KQQ20626.1 DNA-binding transcriptional regulator [Rathayibacter sp. Leaf299]MCJ1697475.1 sugar-binding transcriptional regulator [Rathayibacter caricis]PTL71804.1 sugar-binding transcriptional regulator [Rathayibacter caricis DSM 15933]